MFDRDTDPIPLEDLIIYEDDEVIFDGSEPDRYTVSLATGRASSAARPTGTP